MKIGFKTFFIRDDSFYMFSLSFYFIFARRRIAKYH